MVVINGKIHRIWRGLRVDGYRYKAVTECGVVVDKWVRVSRWWRTVDCEECLNFKNNKKRRRR